MQPDECPPVVLSESVSVENDEIERETNLLERSQTDEFTRPL